jgi:hypothetical protein
MKMPFFLFSFLLIGVFPALAQNSSASKGFFGSIAAKGGLGSAGSDSETVESRDLYRYGGELTLGYRFGTLLFGASAEYNLWRQKTKPSEVDDTNMSGKQLNVAPVVGIGLGPFLFGVKTQLMSSITLDKKNSSGDEIVYTSPAFPAYSAQLNYRLGGRSYVGVEYTSITYQKTEVDGESAKLESEDEITYSGWGLVYGFIF